MNSLDRAIHRFRQLYGDGPVHALRAPARINILGEHVDYVSYLPTASLAFGSREHEMRMLFRPAESGGVRGASMDERFPSFRFALTESQPPRRDELSWEEFVFNRPIPPPHWSNYVKGAVSFSQWKDGAIVNSGFDFLIDSTIPPNSGASSSSALVVLAGAAIRRANRIEFELAELAQDSSQAEWFLGTRGGALDHTAICEASLGYAILLKYGEKYTQPVPIRAAQFRWVTFFTLPADKGREVMMEYNERAAVSRLIIPAMIKDWKHDKPRLALTWLQAVAQLRAHRMEAAEKLAMLINYLPETIRLEEVRSRFPQIFQECEAAFPSLVREHLSRPLKIRNRALHHLGETWRVEEAASTLLSITRDGYIEEGMRMVGDLINQSHASLRDLYEVSTTQVEKLIEIVRSDSHVYGARLMGGGFGGNVLALTTAENVAALIDRVQAAYYQPQNRDADGEGAIMISTPGDGLSAVEL